MLYDAIILGPWKTDLARNASALLSDFPFQFLKSEAIAQPGPAIARLPRSLGPETLAAGAQWIAARKDGSYLCTVTAATEGVRSVEDLSGQPAVPPDPNLCVWRVVCDGSVLAAIEAHADYMVLQSEAKANQIGAIAAKVRRGKDAVTDIDRQKLREWLVKKAADPALTDAATYADLTERCIVWTSQLKGK
jgi:hypothetical protein